jgi:hypothetical protein
MLRVSTSRFRCCLVGPGLIAVHTHVILAVGLTLGWRCTSSNGEAERNVNIFRLN